MLRWPPGSCSLLLSRRCRRIRGSSRRRRNLGALDLPVPDIRTRSCAPTFDCGHQRPPSEACKPPVPGTGDNLGTDDNFGVVDIFGTADTVGTVDDLWTDGSLGTEDSRGTDGSLGTVDSRGIGDMLGTGDSLEIDDSLGIVYSLEIVDSLGIGVFLGTAYSLHREAGVVAALPDPPSKATDLT